MLGYRDVDSATELCFVVFEGLSTVSASESMSQQMVNPERARRHGDPMDLVQLAQSVMKADQFVRATTGGKLLLIVEQIRALQEKVRLCLCPPSPNNSRFVFIRLEIFW